MIYTTGYTGKKPDDLRLMIARMRATLIDIRLSPNSRVSQWRRESLALLLGDSYVNIKSLGNENYKNGGEIRIFNFALGYSLLHSYLEGDVILMCACKDYSTCHRREIADRLKALGHQVEELSTWKES